jgi:transglutaminase-like putative cysteine protease
MPDAIAGAESKLAPIGDGATLAECLQPRFFVDSDHPDIVAFARRTIGDAANDVDKAVRLYMAVRDQVRYDPYNTPMIADAYKASTCLGKGQGYCVNKAGLLAAVARAVGIPARLGYADVRNHLSTKRLLDILGTDIFYYHGYTDLWLDGRWVKATPAFNKELTDKFRLKPLEFDGRTDSIYHEFDLAGRRHMEYLAYRGTYADIPFEAIRDAVRVYYPTLYEGDGAVGAPLGDFAREAESEYAY